MTGKLLATTVLVAAFATPAFADFWIVQDTSSKRCSIVEQKPTTTTMTVVGGDGSVYKSRTEAENHMKTVQVCQSTTTGSGGNAPAPAPR